mmetsp:Transcript_9866/g.22970  ORF Transcript_9866/g.22970 Transcript_9866/m.22970 type:complete len:500 (+) Transcript_9866:63-1562(+)
MAVAFVSPAGLQAVPSHSGLVLGQTGLQAVGSPSRFTEGQRSVAVAAAFALAAAVAHKGRRLRTGRAAEKTEAKKKTGRSIAKETLARLRSRSPRNKPKSEGARKKMPPAPDPWELDEEGRKIFPWPKSFAEIVQTAAYSTMNLIQEGETRLEVCFPPLPLADLDWNLCDLTETRVIDANIQHAIAFAKLIVKDRRPFPQLNPEEAMKNATEGAAVQEPDKIKGLLERRFKKKPEGDLGRTVRILFPNKPDMLRARDIHYDKWRKMERPELLRRGYYNEVNEDAWPGPFEDVFVYIMCQDNGELPKIRNYIEKADAVATRQGRVLRHVIFNLNLNKLRADIDFYQTLLPWRPGQATPKVHLDFFSTFRNAYFIRFGKYTQTVLRDPFNINYVGAMYHAYPSPWQVFMQDPDGNYQPIHAQDLRPAISAVKRKLQRANSLWRDVGLPEDESKDDVYKQQDLKAAGTIDKTVLQFIKEGASGALWWEEAFDEEVSRKWRLA